MPKFGARSKAARDTLDPKLQQIVDIAIQMIDFSILYGYRSKEEQLEIWKQGRELKPGGDEWKKEDWILVKNGAYITKAFPGESNHNQGPPSPAMDLAPYPINWENKTKKIARFYFLAGIIKGVADSMGVDLRWGGDWDSDNDFEDQTFDDLCHFELRK